MQEPKGMIWKRPEYRGRMSELDTRATFEERTKITASSLTSRYSRYADHWPEVVAKHGKTRYYVGAELDAFVAKVDGFTTPRPPADVVRSDIARLRNLVEEDDERIEGHRAGLQKAEKDKKRHLAQVKEKESHLALLQ